MHTQRLMVTNPMKDVSGWPTRLDPATIERYSRSGEWPGDTVWLAALRHAQLTPGRVLVTDGDLQLTISEVVAQARLLAAGLHDMGLRAGDVVSYQLPNWWEALVINLAACMSGLVCNPIVPIYRELEVRFILRDARTKAFFVPGSFRGHDYAAMAAGLQRELERLEHIVVVRGTGCPGMTTFDAVQKRNPQHPWAPPLPNPNAVKLVLYTSGTTGNPKGVLHTHNTLMSEILAVIRFWQVTSNDVVFMPSPVTHVTGYLYALEMPLVAQCSVVLMEKWDSAQAALLVNRHKGTLTVGATPFLVELTQQAATHAGLPSLRAFASGGAPVPPEVVRRARRAMKNCAVFRVYGSSEAPTITLGLAPDDDAELGAVTDGRIVNNAVRICDPAGIGEVPEGQDGEVAVRGPEVMVGYTKWEQTEEAFDGDGYFRTGDLAFISNGGFMTISGRKKDLIIRGGENISAKEIEDALHADPRIAEAAVVAMPHERLGEGVCAFIVPATGHTVDLAAVSSLLVAAGMARQKHPERVESVQALPRTASGKVQKNILREHIKGILAAGGNK